MVKIKESVKQHIYSKFNDLSQEMYSEVIKWAEIQEEASEFDAIVLSDCLVDCMRKAVLNIEKETWETT